MSRHSLAKFSRGILLFAGRCIGWLWFDLFRIRRKLVLDNIRQAFPDWSEEKVLATARRAMAVLGQSIVDVFYLPFFNRAWIDRNFEMQGVENLRQALSQGKGVFCLTLHLGSGDLGVAALNYFGFKVNLVTKSLRNATLNRYWFQVREKHGTRLISDRRSSFEILRSLKRNELVIFVLDQFMGPPLGVKTRFFNRETGTAMGLALLANRSQTPVVPCYTYFSEGGKLVCVFEKEIVAQDFGTNEQTIVGMTQVYTDKIEDIVRKYPDQWMWVHRRWKEYKT